MPYYESVMIARQEIGGGDAERLGEHYEGVLSAEGATIVRREYWGLRRLAYRIRKNRKGHYLMFHIDGPGTAIQEYERQLRIDENVVRYLTMRLDALPDGPSIIMKARAEREERRESDNARREAERRAEGAETSDESPDGDAPAQAAEDSKPEPDSPATELPAAEPEEDAGQGDGE